VPPTQTPMPATPTAIVAEPTPPPPTPVPTAPLAEEARTFIPKSTGLLVLYVGVVLVAVVGMLWSYLKHRDREE